MKKINKATAEKMYASGKTIRLCASKINPCNIWGFYADIDNSSGRTFNQIVNEFSYYNCNDETGKRVCYYTMGE